MKKSLSLNHLNTFYYAAERLSFRDAAASLFISASAVSHQIRNLEHTLGYALFVRLDKAIALTKEGEALFTDIKLPIEHLHNASRKAQQYQQETVLAISVAPIFATAWLLPRLRDFYRQHPDINLQVIASVELVNFATDPFDAVIRLGKPKAHKGLNTPLFNADYVAVCHPSYLNDVESPISPKVLLSSPLVQNSSMPNLWTEFFDSADISCTADMNIAFEVPSTAQMIDALQTGQYVGLVDRQFIQKDIDLGRLVVACGHVLSSENQYTLLAPESMADKPHYQHFAKWLSSQTQPLAP